MKLIDKPLCPWLGAILLPGLLSACGTFDPKVDVAEPVSARPVASVYMEPSNGSLFQPTAYRPLYENHRARLVGDIINITISEAISAKQETTSSLSKAGTVSSGITAVPLVNVAQVAKLSASGNSSNTFDGKGATASTNTFTGTITTTVIEVLRFSGQIDPATIQPGNTVASTQVANVRIEQMGRGAQQEAQGIGWLGRFFLNISPF
jgi:flagellar L-ring protein precursor FlgH